MQYDDPERKRGILTTKDREYLLGEWEIDGQDERNARYRIRQRVKHSVLDIRLIAEELPRDDLKTALDGVDAGDLMEFVEFIEAVQQYYEAKQELFGEDP